jgi:flagellum-specific ATP synthase
MPEAFFSNNHRRSQHHKTLQLPKAKEAETNTSQTTSDGIAMGSLDGWFRTLQQHLKHHPYPSFGTVERLVGLMLETKGPKAKLGDVCLVETQASSSTQADGDARQFLPTEVVGFREGRLLLMPLGEMTSLGLGSRVWNTGKPLQVTVGDELLGRVLDGLGNPIDDRFPLSGFDTVSVAGQPPHPLGRQEISEPLPMGIKSIDGFLTLGKGQRVGIFAGSGVGKSTTLGMIARNSEADMSVIALIGERGREVRDFMENALGEEGLKRSIVVVATAEQPALVKIKASLVATAIAEHFRDQGKQVLLMMDSLTRVAMALREVGLAVGEPPATRGYPPSVFAYMPRLLERAGMGEKGAITGLYTVLVEGDDFNEPIADLVRGLLDGHIILSRQLAQQNHFPAVDVGQSVSRLFLQLASPEHKEQAGILRDLMTIYQKNEDLLSVGAYVRGGNPKLDLAVQIKPLLDDFLKQSVDEAFAYEETLTLLQNLGS